MTKYREILRLFLSLHMKTADIMRSCHVSPNTITKTKKRAAELGLSWPLPEGMTEEKLADIMFPKKKAQSHFLCDASFLTYSLLLASMILRKKYSSSG